MVNWSWLPPAFAQASERLSDSLGELAGGATVWIAVTGLSRSGKTVFVTSLIHNLLSCAHNPNRMPLLGVVAERRMIAATVESARVGRLPQFFADRQGWDVMTATIADVWNRLPPEDHADAAVLVGNYGEAGALERLAGATGIVAISGHNNYWLWGTHGRGTRVLIVLSGHPERLRTWCAGSSRRARPRAAIACPTRITSRSGSAAVRRRRSPRCGRA